MTIPMYTFAPPSDHKVVHHPPLLPSKWAYKEIWNERVIGHRFSITSYKRAKENKNEHTPLWLNTDLPTPNHRLRCSSYSSSSNPEGLRSRGLVTRLLDYHYQLGVYELRFVDRNIYMCSMFHTIARTQCRLEYIESLRQESKRNTRKRAWEPRLKPELRSSNTSTNDIAGEGVSLTLSEVDRMGLLSRTQSRSQTSPFLSSPFSPFIRSSFFDTILLEDTREYCRAISKPKWGLLIMTPTLSTWDRFWAWERRGKGRTTTTLDQTWVWN